MRAKSLCLLSMLVLGGQLTGVGMTPPKRASPTHLAKLPVEEMLNANGTLNLHTGLSGTLDLTGWRVTLDSRRGPILRRQEGGAVEVAEGSRKEVSPQPSGMSSGSGPSFGWSVLANGGLNYVTGGSNQPGAVFAMAVMGSDLYVGGQFNQTHDGAVTGLNNVAKYSGGVWSALAHGGLDGYVYAMAVSGSDLYVGGSFGGTADVAVTGLNGIAKYSGGAWSGLAHNGLSYYTSWSANVYALAMMGSDLYVGGDFNQTHDGAVTGLNEIAKYSNGAWSALPHGGLNGIVHALAAIGSDLYVGGTFSQSYDGSVTGLNNIAEYSSGAWSALARGGLQGGGYGEVDALAAIGSDLYVGGSFFKTADGNAVSHDLIEYTGGAWSNVANNGVGFGAITGNVYALAVNGNGHLYVGGHFDTTGDGLVSDINEVVEYIPSISGGWSPLAHGGVNWVVNALAVSGSNLYVGGDFNQTNDGAMKLYWIAEWGPQYTVLLPLVLR